MEIYIIVYQLYYKQKFQFTCLKYMTGYAYLISSRLLFILNLYLIILPAQYMLGAKRLLLYYSNVVHIKASLLSLFDLYPEQIGLNIGKTFNM